MSDLRSAYDRELAILERQLADGQLSQREFNDALRELEQDARAYAREAAEEAYDREMDQW